MIKLQDLTPAVYYNQSRDFQLIGRLYDIVLNSVKTNADLIYGIPLSENTDTRLMELMSLTLGFKSKHNYNIDQLTAICKSFLSILKVKGTRESITMAANTLLNAEGITSEIDLYGEEDGTPGLILVLPHGLSDVNLLLDLLTYILPAGLSFTLITENTIKAPISTTLNIKSTANYRFAWESETSFVPKISSNDLINPNNFEANGEYHGALGSNNSSTNGHTEGGYIMSTFISNVIPSMDEPTSTISNNESSTTNNTDSTPEGEQ